MSPFTTPAGLLLRSAAVLAGCIAVARLSAGSDPAPAEDATSPPPVVQAADGAGQIEEIMRLRRLLNGRAQMQSPQFQQALQRLMQPNAPLPQAEAASPVSVLREAAGTLQQTAKRLRAQQLNDRADDVRWLADRLLSDARQLEREDNYPPADR